jgi:hypothetical protein
VEQIHDEDVEIEKYHSKKGQGEGIKLSRQLIILCQRKMFSLRRLVPEASCLMNWARERDELKLPTP